MAATPRASASGENLLSKEFAVPRIALLQPTADRLTMREPTAPSPIPAALLVTLLLVVLAASVLSSAVRILVAALAALVALVAAAVRVLLMVLLTLLVAATVLSADAEAGRTPHSGTPDRVEQPAAG